MAMLIYVFSVTAFILQQQNFLAGLKTIWPTEAKRFPIWLLKEKPVPTCTIDYMLSQHFSCMKLTS